MSLSSKELGQLAIILQVTMSIEPCMIVISSSDDGETDDEIEGDSCPETDCYESETLFTPSARSSLAVPVPIEELDDSITVQDCHGTCCKVDMNSPFQLQDKEICQRWKKFYVQMVQSPSLVNCL